MCGERRPSRREIRLREEIRFILQRYDDGALPPAVYEVIKKLQCEVALEQQRSCEEKED